MTAGVKLLVETVRLGIDERRLRRELRRRARACGKAAQATLTLTLRQILRERETWEEHPCSKG